MVALRIFSILLLLIPIILTIRFVRGVLISQKRMNKLKDWSNFQDQLRGWAGDILDLKIREKYLIYCLDSLDLRTKIEKWDKVNQLNEVKIKFGNHIPELKSQMIQEDRESKLSKILKS